MRNSLGFALPNGITIDAQGDVWFAESASNEIGRLNPTLVLLPFGGKFFRWIPSLPQHTGNAILKVENAPGNRNQREYVTNGEENIFQIRRFLSVRFGSLAVIHCDITPMAAFGHKHTFHRNKYFYSEAEKYVVGNIPRISRNNWSSA